MRRTSFLRFLGMGAVAVAAGPTGAAPSSVGYVPAKHAGVTLHIVQVNLNDAEVRVTGALASGGIGKSETFGGLVSRVLPTAAITGTFFGVRSGSPVGDIVIGGASVYHGRSVGTAFGITDSGRAKFVSPKAARTGEYETLFSGGIRLLKGGRYVVRPRAQGFRDSSLYGRKPRTAVAYSRSGRLMLVATNQAVYLGEFAWALRRAGAVDAVAMDGGGSTALFYRGSTISRPTRKLTNLIVVYDRSANFRKRLAHLAPGVAERKAVALALKRSAAVASVEPRLTQASFPVRGVPMATVVACWIAASIRMGHHRYADRRAARWRSR